MKQKAILFNIKVGFCYTLYLPSTLLKIAFILLVYFAAFLSYVAKPSNEARAIEVASEVSGIIGRFITSEAVYVSLLTWELCLVLLIFGS